MLRIGDAQIPWTPLLEVAQVMQRAMSLLVSIGRVTTPRTRVPDVVATVGDELGRRQVGGGCDPFTRVGAILSGTGHRVGLLAHSLDPDYTVHAWRGKPGILAIVSNLRGKGYLGCYVRGDLEKVKQDITLGEGALRYCLFDIEKACELVTSVVGQEHTPAKRQMIQRMLSEINRRI